MRWIPLFLLALALGCSSSDEFERPEVEVTAFEEPDGKRVHFKLREGQVSEDAVKITAENGFLRDRVRSSNLRNAAVFWSKGDGKLKCRFPYGQENEFDWTEGVPLSDVFVYTFYTRKGATVTTRIGRGAPMVPRLLMRVSLDKSLLPAELQWEGREAHHLTRESSLLLVELPKTDKGVLRTGDWNVVLRTKQGEWGFLVGVDPDGTPTASSGFVRRAVYTELYDKER